jgi:hypothetical protein
MAHAGPELHRDRARRAQQLAGQARENAGVERTAIERSERLSASETDPALVKVHRRAAALHRDALRHYEDAAELQLLHAEHERQAAERAEAGGDPDARDIAADARENAVELSELLADRREELADARERVADERERLEEERERRFAAATGHRVPGSGDGQAEARAALQPVETRLTRQDAMRERDAARAGRQQAAIDRESGASARHPRVPESPLREDPR